MRIVRGFFLLLFVNSLVYPAQSQTFRDLTGEAASLCFNHFVSKSDVFSNILITEWSQGQWGTTYYALDTQKMVTIFEATPVG